MTDETDKTPEATDVESAAPGENPTAEASASAEMNETASAEASESTPSAGASEAAAAEKPKPARKPRAAAKSKTAPSDSAASAEMDEQAASAADSDSAVSETAQEAEKPKRTRAAKPKADAADAAKASRQPEPKKPADAPKRGAARRSEQAGGTQVVRAQAKYVRSSARKARLVCDNIRGKSVTDARAILAHTPRAVARDWSKLLESAVANAENNHDLDGEDLVIKAVHADEGPTIKRFRPRAMGRASQIRKRTAHLTILLTPKN